jgi:hypothetical protein
MDARGMPAASWWLSSSWTGIIFDIIIMINEGGL